VARRRKSVDREGLASLQSKRLHLRTPTMADAEAVYAYASDPTVTRFLAWPRHQGQADSRQFLEGALEDWRNGSNLAWLIEDQSEVVGAIGARLSTANAGIGYVLRRECWGRGYATEALQLLSEALLRQGPIMALWALCVMENTASVKVLEKAGFRYVRTLGNYFSCPNLGSARKSVFLYTRTLKQISLQEMTQPTLRM